MFDSGWLCVHAGVVPQWDAATTLRLAGEVERHLQGDELAGFLRVMYGNEPACWRETLEGHDRMRFVVNVLTRIRFVAADGTLDLLTKGRRRRCAAGPRAVVRGAWAVDDRRAHRVWATGPHSASSARPDLLSLDTGCVWGGQLTAVRVDGGRRDVIQLACAQAQAPQAPSAGLKPAPGAR